MASRSGYYDSQMFDRDYESAMQLYSTMGQQIQSLSSLNAASKLNKFLKDWLGANAEKAQLVDNIKKAAQLYDKAELAGRDYARRARNFAQENILTAEGVRSGKKHYSPEDVLEAYEDMATGLLEEYELVIKSYNTVVHLLRDVSHSAKSAEEKAERGLVDAEDGIVRHAPIVAPFVGAVECAEAFSDVVDSVPMKVFLGFAGSIVGILKGAISMALIVPMVVNIADKAKYKKMMEEFNNVAKELERVEFVVKEHRELLAKINGPVKNLSHKYKSIQGRKELRVPMLDRIINESKDLIAACDIYLLKTG